MRLCQKLTSDATLNMRKWPSTWSMLSEHTWSKKMLRLATTEWYAGWDSSKDLSMSVLKMFSDTLRLVGTNSISFCDSTTTKWSHLISTRKIRSSSTRLGRNANKATSTLTTTTLACSMATSLTPFTWSMSGTSDQSRKEGCLICSDFLVKL